MTGTIASFCLMAIAARELSGDITVFQILFCRSLLGVIVISAIILFLGKRELFLTTRLLSHAGRNVFHFGGQFGWVFGIGLLPLAEVFALEFTVPVWVALIAALFLKEKLTLRKIMSIALGLIGVIVIVNPGVEIFDSAALVVLAAAVCYAVAHTTNKSLSNTEKPVTILFYMSLIQMPIGLALSFSEWEMPQGLQWVWLLTIGLTALIGHYCLTKAMQTAEVGVVMTLDFLRLPLIAITGVLLYAEAFDIALIAGGVLILAGNLMNIDTRLLRYDPQQK